jgi:phosphoserine phosphatase RsbU/P
MKRKTSGRMQQKAKGFLQHVPLIILGFLGLLSFILLLDRFFPSRAAHLTIGKSEAIDVAATFLKHKGYNLQGYKVMALVTHEDEGFSYLQKRLGWEKTQELFHAENNNGLDFFWYLSWFKNIPKGSPYEQFTVMVSGKKKILAFSHDFPKDWDWPEGRLSSIPQEKALEMATVFLKEQGIDLEGFKKDNFNTQTSEKRTDHLFSWIKTLEYEGGKVNLQVVVQGDEVGRFRISFGVPASEIAAGNRVQEHYLSSVLVSFFLIFIICLSIQVLFLRRYHEGEVGVKNALLVFFISWIALVVESGLKFRMNAAGAAFGELSMDNVGVLMFFLLSLIVWPFFSIMGFGSWSVGELLGREQFNKKFTALDSLFNKRFFTLNVARSFLNGYLAGFLGLGIVAFLTVALRGLFNGVIDQVNYRVVSSTLPFLIPFLAAISFSLLSEVVFRSFANFLLYRFFKSKWASVFISAFFWAVFANAFWGLGSIGFSLFPMFLGWINWYLCGVFLGYLFWKFDLLTTIVANFTLVGIIQALPLITSSAGSLITQGIAALFLLFLPVFLMVRGFLRGEIFSYEADLVPAHIKRITERVRIAKELEIARQVQQKLLPGESPKIEGFEIEGVCIPANEVGGDYYDFFRVTETKMGIVIGDVSGKGVPAAIYMTLTKGVIQSLVENKTRFSPEQVMIKTNHSLYHMMDHRSFVTMLFAVVDIKRRTLVFARAGHNPLLYFQRGNNQVITLKPQGIALGLERGDVFEGTIKGGQIRLKSGDIIVFYTDGFSEAMNKDLEEYGERQLCRIIQQQNEKPARTIIDTVINDVRQFVKGYPQHDDMTMVVVKVL